jgi:hypothetical protein
MDKVQKVPVILSPLTVHSSRGNRMQPARGRVDGGVGRERERESPESYVIERIVEPKDDGS